MLLSNAPGDLLSAYPVLLLAGDIRFTPDFLDALGQALTRGTRVLLAPRHAEALGDGLALLRQKGGERLEVLEPWLNPETGRPAAISSTRLASLVRSQLPLDVTGDPVQFQINRTRAGWVIELVNNRGVAKKPSTAARIDPEATATVELVPLAAPSAAREWRSGRSHPAGSRVRLTLGPGATEFVEFR